MDAQQWEHDAAEKQQKVAELDQEVQRVQQELQQRISSFEVRNTCKSFVYVCQCQTQVTYWSFSACSSHTTTRNVGELMLSS